jgi:hypothetical protein
MKLTTGLAAVVVIGFLGLVGAITWIALTGHDVGMFVANIGTLLTALAGFIVLIRSQQKQGATIDTIKTQTNGTLSALTSSNESLVNKLNDALGRLEPHEAQAVIENTISKDQVPTVIPDSSIVPVPSE